MTALYVILILFALALLISLIRVGARVEYSESGLVVWAKVCGLSVRVFPMKPKAKKSKKEQAPNAPPEQKKGGNFELVKQLLPVAVDAAGELKRKIFIEDFQMDLLWSLSDPAACAMGFGAANAAVGMIWPVIEQNFHVKKHCIRTAVDFEQGSPTVYILAQATLRLGQLLCLGVRLAVRFLKIYQRVKKQETRPIKQQKEAV